MALFDPAIPGAILAALADARTRRNSVVELPSLDDLAEIVEIAFMASLRFEEGRPIRFTVGMVSPTHINAHQEDRRRAGNEEYRILRFERPPTLTVDVLAKLASAFDPESSAMLVSRASGQLMIWGIALHEPMNFTVFKGGIGWLRPEGYFCTATSSGSLLFTRSDIVAGRFTSGEWRRQALDEPIDEIARKYLLHTFDLPKDPNSRALDPDLLSSTYIASLKWLLHAASQRGAGATVIVLPTDAVESARGQLSTEYPFQGAVGIPRLLSAVVHRFSPEQYWSRIKGIRDLGERLSGVAQLSSMDGALLLASDFEPIAFGAKLHAPRWNGAVTLATGGPFAISRFGTRHNSAVDFIGAVGVGVAFVISEDGPVRAFVKQDANTTLCWPDCRETAMIY